MWVACQQELLPTRRLRKTKLNLISFTACLGQDGTSIGAAFIATALG